MGRWISSTLGAINLDQLAQLGVELGSASGPRYDVIGWSATGARFAVNEGFESRDDALDWIAHLGDQELIDGG